MKEPNFKNFRALIVDDNENCVLALSHILNKIYGIEVDTATGGFEAIKKSEDMNYDIIFMDYIMEDFDGLLTSVYIRTLRDEDWFTKVPIIVVSGATEKKEIFLTNGINEFIEKPASVANIEPILKKYLK